MKVFVPAALLRVLVATASLTLLMPLNTAAMAQALTDFRPTFCLSGLTWNNDYRVIVVAPGFHRFGFQEGDLITHINDAPVSMADAGAVDGWAAWELAHRPGDSVRVALRRTGETIRRTLTCGNARPVVQALANAQRELKEARGLECTRQVWSAEQVIGEAAFLAELRVQCIQVSRFANAAAKQHALAEVQFEMGNRLLREARVARTLDRDRGAILRVITTLEAQGFQYFASDLNARLQAEPVPPSAALANEGTATGTCFAVGPTGTLLTAAHVVARQPVRVRMANGRWHDATVVRTSRSLDVAVLTIDAATPDFLRVARAGNFRLGQRVFTIGFPAVDMLGENAKFTDGAITSLSGIDDDERFVQVTVPIQPGNSGGPLVTETGELVGVVLATARSDVFEEATGALPQNINWAVRADAFLSILPGPRPAAAPISRQSAIERTQQATCFVEAGAN